MNSGTHILEKKTDLDFLNTVLQENGTHPSALIPILQAVQEKYRYLPQNILMEISEALEISAATFTALPHSMPNFPWSQKENTSSKFVMAQPAMSGAPCRYMRQSAGELI